MKQENENLWKQKITLETQIQENQNLFSEIQTQNNSQSSIQVQEIKFKF
jgi:hypothetical protein